MNTSFKIAKSVENIFLKNEVLGITEIANILWISRTITHKAVKDLLGEKKVKKVGKWAHTRYKSLIFEENKAKVSEKKLIDFQTKKFLDEYFYKFSSTGKLLLGFEWFQTWIFSRNFDFEKSLKNYKNTINYIEKLKNKCGLLDATSVFSKKFQENYMKKVVYADEYSCMEFGRTKLAEMTFFAKQSQNKKLINESLEEIFYKLECLIHTESIDAIAITPWSIERKNQLLQMLQTKLEVLNLPFIFLRKYFENDISIPQKSIKSKKWRIENAENTIFVLDKNLKKYKNILLIDDFVGSGATLNITARKLSEKWAKNIIWFSFVGSLDLTYEVINEI